MSKHLRSSFQPLGVILALAFVFAFAGFGSNRGNSKLQAGPSPSMGYDAGLLLRDFQEAQQNEMKSLLTKEKAAAKDLRNVQSSKQKEFDAREKVARRKFFADPHPGSEKRAYMHDLLARRDVFRKELSDERAKAKDDADERVRALKNEQIDHMQKFQDTLNRGERPSDTLWPQPGH